jgi:hypothetical protein
LSFEFIVDAAARRSPVQEGVFTFRNRLGLFFAVLQERARRFAGLFNVGFVRGCNLF